MTLPVVPETVAAANQLTRRWVAELDGGNHVLSGAGAWVVLAALLAGADGDAARDELERALAVGRDDAAQAAIGLGELIEKGEGTSSAMAVWVSREIEMRPGYRDALGEAVAVGPMPAQREADDWVAERTDGLIEACPIDLTPDVLLALIGIVTAIGDWERQFTPTGMPWQGGWVDAVTRTDPDAAASDVLDGASGLVSRVRLRTSAGFEVHLLGGEPGADQASVLTCGIDAVGGSVPSRPASTLALGERAGMLRAERVPGQPDENGRLRILAPTFTVREKHDLLQRLSLFGLETASQGERGHFPLISDTPLFVAAAAQDAVAELSATGFRAAAVTAVGMARGAAMLPPGGEVLQYVAEHDRPFGFLVVEPDAGLVLFAGWVASP